MPRYQDALVWCRDALHFDFEQYEGTAGEVLLTPLAEECCKALEGFEGLECALPDAFFEAAEMAARKYNAVV